MLRIFGMMVVVMLAVACEQETFPPQCVEEVFDEEKYKDADYPIVRDVIRKIDLDNYKCFKHTALEMLNTPEKQALYTSAIMDKHSQILVHLNHDNKYVEGGFSGSEGVRIVTDSRLKTQILIDKFLRHKPAQLDETKIPEFCRMIMTVKDRNVCYKRLFSQYIDTYIFNGYSPHFDKNINYKPEFINIFNSGVDAIRELLEAASDDHDYIEQYMELYYLDLIEHFADMIEIHKK